MKPWRTTRRGRRFLPALILSLTLFLVLTPAAYGAQDPAGEESETDASLGQLSQALPAETRRLLEPALAESGEGGWKSSAAAIAEAGFNQVRDMLRGVLASGAALLVIVFLCDGAQMLYFQEKDSRLLRCTAMTGALAIVLLSAGDLSNMIGLGVETIQTMNDFSKTLLPLLGAACAASGGISSGAVREVATTFFADILITCINQLLIPLVYIYIGAITANAVLQQQSLQSIAKGIRKFIVWSLTILLSAFTAYLTLSSVISGTADAAALRVAKFAISGAVPVVGGILSNAASTILVGASILKNTIGIFGTLAVFALCITPFIQIGIQYLLYKAAAFFAEMIDQTGLARLMDEIGGAFGMILGMTGACALLLIISLIMSISAVVPV